MFDSLQDNQSSYVKEVKQQLDKILGFVAVETQQQLQTDEVAYNTVKSLLIITVPFLRALRATNVFRA